MKISYKVLKRYINNIKSVDEVARDLVMHTAEVEDIVYEGENLKDVFIGEVKTCKKHPDSEKLNCTTVEVNGKTLKIVCGASNVKAGLKVPVALVGAKLKDDLVLSKVKIRGEESEGMICSKDELGLVKERQEGILELPEDAPLNMNFRDYLQKNDIILEIDNKAINHRPDMFSHIGVAREIEAISGNKLDYEYLKKDFSSLNDLGIKVENSDVVKRYKGVKINNVKNIESPSYIKEVLGSAGVNSKGLLIDISNYSLYLYGQPIHCFDADKIDGDIIVRFAKKGEKFIALDDKEYNLDTNDIVIADSKKVLCLGGIIGGKSSAVTDETTSILVEAAHFDQAILRMTGKRLGIRTDALNIFEKDITNGMQEAGISLVVDELQKNLTDIKLVGHSDLYPIKQKEVTIDFDLEFINNLIGESYSKEDVEKILSNLGIKLEGKKIIVPFWRKDLNYKADIAEEIARIIGYDKIRSSLPRLETGAVTQKNIYRIKDITKNFFSSKGFFDLYTYSFVNEELMSKCLGNTDNLVSMKNPLSEELTHLRGSLIPNMMLSLERNKEDYDELKLFEIEKVFNIDKSNNINEFYSLSGVKNFKKDVVYYDIQNLVSSFLRHIMVYNFSFEEAKKVPSFAHPSRTAEIIVRGKSIGVVGEIHPKVCSNFSIKDRIGFFEINIDLLDESMFQIIKAKDISNFQENNFDLNFVIDKNEKSNKLKDAISKANENITNVELLDIYENEEKIPGKRSLTYKIYIQSMEKTLDDNDKAKIISEIISKVSKIGGELRS